MLKCCWSSQTCVNAFVGSRFFSKVLNLNTKMWITFCRFILIVQKNSRIFVKQLAIKLFEKQNKMTNTNNTQTEIETILRANVGKFCDYKTKNGEEGSGRIKIGATEVWVAYGHKDESAVDACDIISVENIED